MRNRALGEKRPKYLEEPENDTRVDTMGGTSSGIMALRDDGLRLKSAAVDRDMSAARLPA